MDALARTLHRRQIIAGLTAAKFAVEPDQAPDTFLVTDRERRTAKLRFDPDGGVATVSADGRSLTRWFDSDGRLRRLLHSSGLDVRMETSASRFRLERVGHGAWTVASDPFGLPTRTTFPDGSESLIDWDTPGGETLTDRAGNRSQRLRGDDGALTGWIDACGGRTRLESCTEATGEVLSWRSAGGRVQELGLDETGNLASWRVDGSEVATASGKGPADLPGTVRYADGHWVRLEADADGRLAAAHGPNGTVRLTYDESGRLIGEDQNGLVVGYERDRTGLLTAIVAPGGERLGFGYDASGRLSEVRDWGGGRTRIDWAQGGQLAGISHPNGVSTRLESDLVSRVTAVATLAPGSATPLFEARYAYDVADRLVEAVERGVTSRYSYDGLDRLTGVASSDAALSEAWSLDALGNRIVDRGAPYAADPDNLVSGAGANAIVYDRLGRTRRVRTAAGPAQLTYDGQGRLTRLETVSGTVAEYGYDALGRRIWKRVDGRTTRFLWAGQTLLTEWTDAPGGAWTRRDHLFLPDLFLPIAMRVDGRIHRLHGDRRGAIVAMTDERGAPLWQATPRPFGAVSPQPGGVDNPWRLPNQYADPESGLHYNLARYMHPELGRYLTPDPLFDPATRGNWYIYGAGDPLANADPTGQFIIPAIFVAMAVGAVIGAAFKAWDTRNQEMSAGDRTLEILKGAGVGAAVAAVGFLAGHAVLGALGLSTAAGGSIGALMGISALEGAVSSVAESCAESAYYDGMVSGRGAVISGLIGAVAGAVTFGIGGVIAARLARRAARKAAEKATREAAEKAAKELYEETTEKVGKPSGVNRNSNRAKEMPYKNPPEVITVKPGQPLDVDKLDPKKTYLWVVDEDGVIKIAPEKQPGFGKNADFPDGRPVKHGDLTPGPEGKSRGPARAGGELKATEGPDGEVRWVMDNDSSYSHNRADGARGDGDNLNSAHDLLTQTGTNTDNIDTKNLLGP